MTDLDQAERLARLQQRRRAAGGDRRSDIPSTAQDAAAPRSRPVGPSKTRRRGQIPGTSTKVATASMAAAAMFGLISAMALDARDNQSSEPAPISIGAATVVSVTPAGPSGTPTGPSGTPTAATALVGSSLPDAVRDTRVPVVRLVPVHSGSVSRTVASPKSAPAKRATTRASR